MRNEKRRRAARTSAGVGAAATRPPAAHTLVFLHGFLGQKEDWNLAAHRMGTEWRCRVPTLPGHGPRPEPIDPGTMSFETTVEQMARRMREEGQGPVDLVGYSMGGRLAYGLMSAHPDRLRKAVVVGAHPGLDDEERRKERRSLDEKRAESLENSNFGHWLLNWYLKQPLFEGLAQSPEFFTMIDRRRTGKPRALAAAIRVYGLGRQPPLRQRLARCAVPALLVAGSRDEKYAALNRELADANPRFEAVTVPGAGHAPHVEKPDEFVALIREFLTGP